MIDPMFFDISEMPSWFRRTIIGAVTLTLLGAVVGAAALALYAIGVNLILVVPALMVCYVVGWFWEEFE
ncbi:MAG: hypothetical protein IH622_13465 [Ochrobactrum anthropi]|uniref:Uncharacterized protein n=1 Tax=Brucella anthropi TaxID=529 RepID=A0A8I0N6X5_BRUAN|nr:hypothetical protein [Brucella anthropi]MBE0561805.1 hypothetical protein [Brucella anthropi]